MIANQIRVLVQRVENGGRKPAKILLSQPLMDALKLELQGHMRVYRPGEIPSKDFIFCGVPVIVVKGTTEPIIELVPLPEKKSEFDPLDLV